MAGETLEVPGPREESRGADPWQVAAALVSASSLGEQLTLLLEAAPRVGGADLATIYLRDRRSGDPTVVARAGYVSDEMFGPPRRRGLTHLVLTRGQPVLVGDTLTDPRVNPVVRAQGLRTVLALPLLTRALRPGTPIMLEPADAPDALHTLAGDVPSTSAAGASTAEPDSARRHDVQSIGVLFVSARRPNAFSAETVESLKGLAALASVAIENGYLLEGHRAAEARLADALRLREQFASAAAHELKAPLTPLKGYAQAIRRRLERAPAGLPGTGGTAAGAGTQASQGAGAPSGAAWLTRALDIMLGQIDRLDRLVTDLLDVSRLRAGQFTIEPAPAEFVALARESFERVRDGVGAQQEALEPELAHALRLRCDAESLPGVWDNNRIDQLITNLLHNAVKYSPDGGTVQLLVEPAAASTGVDLVGRARSMGYDAQTPEDLRGWVYLAVRDEGIGLAGDEAARARLFDPFTRGDNVSNDRFSGFGLGLYICAEVARRHGGTIWAESAGVDRGSTFHVLLPPRPPA